jgi:DNA-binding NarL/FixJ family response regulator
MTERGEPEPIRVVVADDHPLVRDATRLYLEQAGGIAVVGMAGTGAAALELVGARRPDVLVLDVQLPDMSGVDVARRMAAAFPGVAVLVFTGYDDVGYARRLRQVGIRGYLRKTASREELVGAVRGVAAGRTVLIADSPGAVLTEGEEPLTAREHEVLQLVADGLSNDEVARALTISPKTAEFHVGHLLRKLGARSRAHAVARARQQGLVIASGEAPLAPRGNDESLASPTTLPPNRRP